MPTAGLETGESEDFSGLLEGKTIVRSSLSSSVPGAKLKEKEESSK